MKGIDLNATYGYVLKDERALSEAQQTEFMLGVLTLRDEQRIFGMMRDTDNKAEAAAWVNEACRLGLRGWKNLTTPDGDPIAFTATKSGAATDAALAWLPLAVRTELCGAILARATITGDEEKN